MPGLALESESAQALPSGGGDRQESVKAAACVREGSQDWKGMSKVGEQGVLGEQDQLVQNA